MDADVRERVVEFCRRELDPDLRSILAYTTEGADVLPAILYVRDDIEEGYDDLEAAAERVLRDFALENVGTAHVEHVHRFGALQGTIRVFEDAVVMRFPRGTNEGVAISLDPGAEIALHRFIREWNERFGAAPE